MILKHFFFSLKNFLPLQENCATFTTSGHQPRSAIGRVCGFTQIRICARHWGLSRHRNARLKHNGQSNGTWSSWFILVLWAWTERSRGSSPDSCSKSCYDGRTPHCPTRKLPTIPPWPGNDGSGGYISNRGHFSNWGQRYNTCCGRPQHSNCVCTSCKSVDLNGKWWAISKPVGK